MLMIAFWSIASCLLLAYSLMDMDASGSLLSMSPKSAIPLDPEVLAAEAEDAMAQDGVVAAGSHDVDGANGGEGLAQKDAEEGAWRGGEEGSQAEGEDAAQKEADGGLQEDTEEAPKEEEVPPKEEPPPPKQRHVPSWMAPVTPEQAEAERTFKQIEQYHQLGQFDRAKVLAASFVPPHGFKVPGSPCLGAACCPYSNPPPLFHLSLDMPECTMGAHR